MQQTITVIRQLTKQDEAYLLCKMSHVNYSSDEEYVVLERVQKKLECANTMWFLIGEAIAMVAHKAHMAHINEL